MKQSGRLRARLDTEIQLQRDYYASTAKQYETQHVHEKDAHFFALSFLIAAVDFLELQSILDIGSGTGRALLHLKRCRPHLRVTGIEPVKELREIGYAQGLSESELIDGDANHIPMSAGEFDLVCEFGVLHHLRNPERVVSEMLRVASRAIFISDSNGFGQGTPVVRRVKQLINAFGLWPLADWLKTAGKGYTQSDGDGISYSYSVFNSYRQIERHCTKIHLLNTSNGGINPYRTAGQVAVLGIKS